jgi:hypothetical protein
MGQSRSVAYRLLRMEDQTGITSEEVRHELAKVPTHSPHPDTVEHDSTDMYIGLVWWQWGWARGMDKGDGQGGCARGMGKGDG